MKNSQQPQDVPLRVEELLPLVMDSKNPAHSAAVREFRQLGGVEFLDFADLARLVNDLEHSLHAVSVNELFRRYGEVPLNTSGAKLSPHNHEIVRPSSIQTATMLSLFHKIENGKIVIRTEGEFYQLLVLETMRELYNLIRSRKPKAGHKQPLEGAHEVELEVSPYEVSPETREARTQFRRWLGQILGEADIYLFEQAYVIGRPTAELAAEYAITSDTMRVRLQRVRDRIKERLGELPFDAEDLFETGR